MEQRLYEAALSEASAATLPQIHEVDWQNLVMIHLNASPLHLAALRGNLEFVKRVVHQIPELAEALDSKRRTPLHLASAKGHIDIVKELVSANVNSCISRDLDGRNPLHAAIVNGKADVLEVMFQACPLAAQARVDQDETVFHLCVKHNQVGALELLLRKPELRQLVNAPNADGNTLFHLAVSVRNFEILEALLQGKRVNVNVKNANGVTALDVLLESKPPRRNALDLESWLRVRKCICERGAATGNNIVEEDHWLAKKKDSLIVVAALIAAVAFQVVMSPPGGVWQDTTKEHKAGETIMAFNSPIDYSIFLRLNTAAFVGSLSVILFLTSDLPINSRLALWGLLIYIAIAAFALSFTYAVSINAVTPDEIKKSTSNQLRVTIMIWATIPTAGMCILASAQTIKPIKRTLTRFRNIILPRTSPLGTV